MTTTLLGGLSPTRFLRDIWHKRPLLIRNAVPGFSGLLSAGEMQQLACRDDVESRLIQGSGTHWQLDHGPFKKSYAIKYPLLVYFVNIPPGNKGLSGALYLTSALILDCPHFFIKVLTLPFERTAPR